MEKQTYTEAIERVEEIVSELESGQLDIDDVSTRLKEAQQLLKFCKTRLNKVENDVKKILEDGEG
ncbi:exodeoxyribonuclease VII small subunit [Pseudoprevotella muciniphila]|jgi:exodeoxyribonuclease VII small subunit|uniref:Exodeoxyribonuclease VII small subunit n=1 Tax=Pseudoprevotella muciniphila TaxID=2133944 RepID=A0A5P8E8U5_9BACT|nr:exodeoxyribonuclease VII small subunit [Pseudoprevotella muciniphila]QFQ13376.1 exodeoxyribonuclease VII small subunit [Pseudoprevotella muciniphila]